MTQKKGLEVSTLVTVLIIVVFILVALAAIYALWQRGNPSGGESSLCRLLPGWFGGCS